MATATKTKAAKKPEKRMSPVAENLTDKGARLELERYERAGVECSRDFSLRHEVEMLRGLERLTRGFTRSLSAGYVSAEDCLCVMRVLSLNLRSRAACLEDIVNMKR